MRSFIQNNTATVLILIATLVLAGVATFTAVRLYQLRVQPVSPTSPQRSSAQVLPSTQPMSCRLSFTLLLGTPAATAIATASATASASATPRATATSSPLAGLGGLATATPTATAVATPKATAAATASPPQLPNAGTTFPTLVGIAAAVLLLITAFVLAL